MTTPTAHSGLQYRPDIDGLRAVAVLAVLFCHAELGLPGGYVGVDVFFVISGYLITGLILKDLRLQRFSMLDFWERRVRRILPALAATLIATLAAAWFLFLPDDFVGLAKSTIAVSLLSANLYFWRDSGYFAQASEEKPLLHTWSLAVEEQFYIFVPLGLAVIWRLSRGKHLFALVAFAATASLLLSVLLPPYRAGMNFYFLPTRAWELFAGSLLFISHQYGWNAGEWTKGILGIIGILLILCPCVTYTKETVFPGLAAVPPVLGAVLIIWSGTDGGRGVVTRILASRAMVFIGLISYSLYLWHWPLLAFARYLSITPPGPLLRGTLAAASIPLAVLSWKFIETPFRKRQLLPTRRSALAGGMATLIGFAVIGCLIWMNQGLSGRLPEFAQKLDRTGGEPTRFRFDYNPHEIPKTLHPLGVQNKKPSILVWGDSISMSFMPAADAVLAEMNLSGYGAGYAGMAPALNYSLLASGKINNDAAPQNQAIFDFIRDHDISTVWLVGSWQNHLRMGGNGFESALKKTIAQLRNNGKTVCFVIDPPAYAFDMRRLLVRKSMKGDELTGLGMTVSDYHDQQREVRRFAKDLEAMSISIMDPTQDLLDPIPQKMAVFDEDGSYYDDECHLSRHGSMQLRPMIRRWLEENTPPAVP